MDSLAAPFRLVSKRVNSRIVAYPSTTVGDLCNSARRSRGCEPTESVSIPYFAGRPLQPRIRNWRYQHPHRFQSPTSRGGLCNLAAGGDPARMVAMFQSPTSRGGLCNPVVLDGGLEGLIVFQSPTSRGGLCNAILNSGTSLWQAPGGPMSSFRRRGSNWEGMVNLPPLGPVSRLTTPSARSAQEI
jgi:hypothetical protein